MSCTLSLFHFKKSGSNIINLTIEHTSTDPAHISKQFKMWFTIFAGLLLTLAIYKFFFSGSKSYWKKYGVREIDGSPGASSFDIYRGVKDISERDDYVYKSMGDDKFCGMVELSRKVILIKDLDLMKKIMIRDFDNFAELRDLREMSAGNNVLLNMLLSLRGEKWKHMRKALTPSFSSGKIRGMMEYFNGVGKVLTQTLKSEAKEYGFVNVDVSKCVTKYTVDVIASIVYGIQADTTTNQTSQFAKMAARLGNINWVKVALTFFFPKLTYFGLEPFDMKALEYFEKLSAHGVDQRRSGKVKRNDFLQLLIEAQTGEGGEKKFSDDSIHAQTVMFFLTGLTTTVQVLSFAVYVLAAHPDIQYKIREEVDSIAKEDGSMDYEELSGLTYMDSVVSETIRRYPPVLRIERECVKSYKDPETGLVCPKGTFMVIPVNSVQLDERYYPNPEKFEPERFSPKNKSERNPFTFLAFGAGPRGCIGIRYALMKVKAGLAHIVHNFLIEPTSKTPLPVTEFKAGTQLFPPKDLELKFITRST